MATRTDIHQLEGQLALMKDDIDRKDAIIHDLSVKNKQLEDRLKRVEGVVDTLQLNQRNARFHSINNEQYQRKNNLVIFGIKEADKEAFYVNTCSSPFSVQLPGRQVVGLLDAQQPERVADMVAAWEQWLK